MLQSWLQGLPDDYAVKDLINEIKNWIEEGYVNSTIWKRLQNCVSPGVLPTYSERVHKRKRSESSSPESKKKASPSPAGSGASVGKLILNGVFRNSCLIRQIQAKRIYKKSRSLA